MSIKKVVIDEEFERLQILPEHKSLENISRNSLIGPADLIQDYSDTAPELKELKKLENRIETGIKKMITAENSVQGIYIGVKDYLSGKFYGRITTMDDLFSKLLFSLSKLGNNFENMIKKGDASAEKLNQHYYSLRRSENDIVASLNVSNKRLEDLKALALKIEPLAEQAKLYEEREEYIFQKRELTRSVYKEQNNLNSMQIALNRKTGFKNTSDLLVRVFETVNFANGELLNENRHYIEVVEITILPYLQYIRTSERYLEISKVEEDINKLTTKTHDLFREGAKKIAIAYNKIGKNSISDRYLASLNDGLGSKGYLDD